MKYTLLKWSMLLNCIAFGMGACSLTRSHRQYMYFSAKTDEEQKLTDELNIMANQRWELVSSGPGYFIFQK